MMMQPGLAPADCENYITCGQAVDYPSTTVFDLQRTWPDGDRRPWRLDRNGAATAMLLQRGAPQTVADLGLNELLDELGRVLATLGENLLRLRGYIAPSGATMGATTQTSTTTTATGSTARDSTSATARTARAGATTLTKASRAGAMSARAKRARAKRARTMAAGRKLRC